jgi:hypothetical protein
MTKFGMTKKLGVRHDTPTAGKKLIKADLPLSALDDEEDLKFIDDADVYLDETVPSSSPIPKNKVPKSFSTTQLKQQQSQQPIQSSNFNRSSKTRFSLRNITRYLPSLDMSSNNKSNERKTSAPDISSEIEIKATSRRNSKTDQGELIVNPHEDPREQATEVGNWTPTPEECLSLTLDEVQHIRTELTKAELESLGVTRTLKEDLEKGKICFTCLKTRFSFLGPWKVVCKLCKRTICEKCSTSMNVPGDLGLVSPSSDDGSVSPSSPSSETKSSTSLMKLCRDCKVLVEKLVETSHNNYNNSGLARSPSIRRPTFIVSSV